MEYRAVGNRCAVDINALGLPISNAQVLSILVGQGFKVIEVDLIVLARQCVDGSLYRRGARPTEAPGVVDCSSLTKWLYGQRGICLPRRSIQQRELGQVINSDELVVGDLIFVSGLIDYYYHDPADGVGHVGIVTADGSIIHAANKKANVVEVPLDKFIDKNGFRGARRYFPKEGEVLTLETPPEREVEIADDIKWIVLQTLGS